MRKSQKFIWPLLLVVLLIASAIIFNDQRISADQTVSNSNTNTYIENSNTNIDSTDNTNSNINQNSSPSTDNRQLITNDFSLPTLMYHHIRDFNDPADQIGTNLSVSPADFAKQLDLIQSRGYTTITFQDILDGYVPDKAIILTFDDGYDNFYLNAYPELKKRGMKAVSFIIVNDIGKDTYMTGDQIVEINNNGIEIGSHTLSHPDLSTATNTRATSEIVDSKTQLETLIGKKIISLCYPSGKFTTETETTVKNAGYDFAVTTKSGITTFNDFYALNRYRINNGTSISGWVK